MMNDVAERLDTLDRLDAQKSKRWDLVIELNKINEQLSHTPKHSRVKTIDGSRLNHSALVSEKYRIENELIKTKREIQTLSETVRHY